MADDAGKLASLYEVDVVAWAEDQAAALRGRGGGRHALDYDNLAEEIDDVGRSVERACRSCIDRIIEHLLKLEFAPEPMRSENVRLWRGSVMEHRYRLQDDLTPTLRRRLPEELQERCRRQADVLTELGVLERGEAAMARLREGYSWEQVTSTTWWPEAALFG